LGKLDQIMFSGGTGRCDRHQELAQADRIRHYACSAQKQSNEETPNFRLSERPPTGNML
jgi:hypothetical protein